MISLVFLQLAKKGTHLAVTESWIAPGVRREDTPHCVDSNLVLIRCVLGKPAKPRQYILQRTRERKSRAMKVLLNVLGARALPSLIVGKDLRVDARVL